MGGKREVDRKSGKICAVSVEIPEGYENTAQGAVNGGAFTWVGDGGGRRRKELRL